MARINKSAGLTKAAIKRESKAWRDVMEASEEVADWLGDDTRHGVCAGFFLGRGLTLEQARYMVSITDY